MASTERASRVDRQRWRSEALPEHRVHRHLLQAPDGDATEWGKAGRIGVYTANFGDVMGHDSGRLGITALAGVSAAILCLQEASEELWTYMANQGRLCSPARFTVDRGAGGDGLLIAGRSALVSDVLCHEELSGSRGSAKERSSQLICTLRFKTGLAGRGSVGVANLHLHRDLAKRGSRSALWQGWCRQLGAALRGGEVRVIAGDLNMGLFLFGESMAEFAGLLVQLVASHREVAMTSALAGLDDRGLRKQMRFDSCGIWLVGGVYKVRTLSVDLQCLSGAIHPALLHVKDRTKFKHFQRGYPWESYMRPAEEDSWLHHAGELPAEESIDLILGAWAQHRMEPLGAKMFKWELDLRETSHEQWVHCADCLPKSGEQFEAAGRVWSVLRSTAGDFWEESWGQWVPAVVSACCLSEHLSTERSVRARPKERLCSRG